MSGSEQQTMVALTGARAGTETTQRSRGLPIALRRERRAAWAFLTPALAFFAVFLVLPFGFAAVLAFSTWTGFDLSRIDFTGLHNFAEILSPRSTFVAPILVNTLLFAIGAVAMATVGAIIVAGCIDRLRFQGFWRAVYFLPVVATVVAIGNVWKMMYQPAGLINGLLNRLGVNSIGFLSDPDIALPSVAVVQAWASIGTAVLILTAGLKGIDQTYYEAAALDGAGTFSTFLQITLPLLRPSLLFVLITQFIGGLQSFALIIVMTTDGGPINSTNVAAFEMYQQAFKFGAWGTASAMAMVLFVIIFVITLIQLWIARLGGEETS
ncbi:multiple sugar transport system permease protein [Microlunatus soli]|uniref:Multiple sugar transport system permease protein n=2 Tax=Microlunatus soli TaxID=630515 RepID=A0A1H1XIL4_9ACTN|nr:multiple sugar transport system permease protein [Microlunatus soli]